MAEKRKTEKTGGAGKPAETQANPATFAKAPGFLAGSWEREPVVLSTRVRLARNLASLPFPRQASAAQKREVLESCAKAFASLPPHKSGTLHDISKLGREERTLLVESHLISKELAEAGDAAVFLSHDQTCSVMINEEDHLRIQVVHGGSRLAKAWKSANELDDVLCHAIRFAFSPRLGYLTACPTNLGTGMRASFMLHLPGLVISGQMERICRALGTAGITVRGWLGEGSDAAGSIFQISNQHTLGHSEKAISQQLEGWLHEITQQETNARLRLLESDNLRLFDQISRAFGLLRNAILLTSAEAMGALSLMRLGCDLGLLPPGLRSTVDRLLIEAQSAHIQSTHDARNSRAEDSCRAMLIRRKFLQVPEPAFHRLMEL
ncbi:MAG: protein arginine kinase [Puniceicoccales bacterium]|jgi:protein arginine kinase|nr:protein arginine kinase [Puniceicoccales bacterium]